MEYDNKNRGVLFKNDRKDTDTQPDYKGKINVDGVDMWISAWIKEGKTGKFMSLSVSEMKSNEYKKQPPKSDIVADIADDLPF